jgi:hypothetical protein
MDGNLPTAAIVPTTICGFAAFRLQSETTEAIVVPELGGRMVQFHRRGGREWLYHPGDEIRLFSNQPNDSFRLSTHVGLDECLPSISPATVEDRVIPDHGEVWNRPWTVDESGLEAGRLTLAIDLPISPFRFTRTLRLDGAQLRADYQLENLSERALSWAWAFHALFRFRDGDRLELPVSVQEVRTASLFTDPPLPWGSYPWPSPRPDIQLDRLRLDDGRYIKAYVGPLTEGRARLVNDDGTALTLTWDTSDNPFLGLWLTRGGYLGQHCLGIEPANRDRDSLAGPNPPRIGPREIRQWSIALQIDGPTGA